MYTEALQKMGITALNSMQKNMISKSKTNDNLVLLSPTGSGKTLAFLLSVLQKVDQKAEGIQTLIVVPSRELAIQINDVFKSLKTGLKSTVCYGGHEMRVEKNQLQEAPVFLIGTPGRIVDHINRGHIDLSHTSHVILDEYDKSLEFGFKRELKSIFDNLHRLRTRYLTSATVLTEYPKFLGPIVFNEINLLSKKETKLEFKRLHTTSEEKLETLFHLLCSLKETTSLIFCNHREAVDRISETLKKRGISHGTFHGGLEQQDRERALIKFRNGSSRILICTDLAARGLDIPEIGNVIHYQIPRKEEDFIHRNGRTARMHAEGKAFITICETEFKPDYIMAGEAIDLPTEDTPPKNPIWETLFISAGKKDKISKFDLVGFFYKTGKLTKEELGQIEVKDKMAFVAVSKNKVKEVCSLTNNKRIKKQKVRISVAF
ncbi:MAG: DEAD/DEAH box helicase [Flavobacteriales bacterium]